MTLTPVKFQRNRSKTVGGVAYTKYLLFEAGRKDGKVNTMSPHFSSKRLGTTIGAIINNESTTTTTEPPKNRQHLKPLVSFD